MLLVRDELKNTEVNPVVLHVPLTQLRKILRSLTVRCAGLEFAHHDVNAPVFHQLRELLLTFGGMEFTLVPWSATVFRTALTRQGSPMYQF